MRLHRCRHLTVQFACSLLCASLLALLASCHVRELGATVGCGNIQKLQTGMGLLNTPGVLLGNIIDLDPGSKHAGYGGRFIFQNADVTIQPGDNKTQISDSSALSITFSGQVSKEVSAQLASQLSDNMQLNLANSEHHQIDHPDPILNRSDNLTTLKNKLLNAQGHRFLLVVAGNTAQSVTFSLKSGTTNKLSVNIPNTGQFDLTVDYSCQGDLTKELSAEHAAGNLTFFKVSEIVLNSDNSLSTKTFDQNLGDYDLTNAAR